MEIKGENNYFPALTGLRAIAAFMVYFHHFNPINKQLFGGCVYNFFSELHIGVTLFFVLSGFLIAYRYYNSEKIDFRKYLINRFSRIYPMYFILTTITFLLLSVYNSEGFFPNFKIYLLNITFLRGFFDDFKFSGIAQGWSLTVEEIFYFSAPLFFLIVKRSKLFLIVLPSIILSIGFLLVFLFQDVSFYGFMKNQDFMLDFTFFGRCIEFFVGISLGIFINNFKNVKFRFTTYIGILLICLCVILLVILKENNNNGTDCPLGKTINTLVLPLIGIIPLFIGLIYEKTLISKILKTKLFQILGKSSYVFYLIHIGFFVSILNKISGNYIFHFICLNIIAIILYTLIEAPVNSFFKGKIKS